MKIYLSNNDIFIALLMCFKDYNLIFLIKAFNIHEIFVKIVKIVKVFSSFPVLSWSD